MSYIASTRKNTLCLLMFNKKKESLDSFFHIFSSPCVLISKGVNTMWAKIKPYVISILIPLGVGIFSSLFTRGNMDIYSTINVPPLAPPSILFPIVWTILYILMGVSSGMIYTSGQKSGRALTIYGISLFVNFLWSIIFFNLKAFLFAFIWLVLLIFLVAFTIVEYLKINKVAAYLQIPYLLWVAFAGYLSFGIFLLN